MTGSPTAATTPERSQAHNAPAMGAAAISIRGLRKSYGRHEAVRDIDLEVAPGEIFAFLGPNGSGKTTLFRILSTLLPAPRGSVNILDQDLAEARDSIRLSIGVVFQSPSLDKQLTAREMTRSARD